MSTPDVIKAALERNAKVVHARPSVGQGPAVTKVTLNAGLACEVEEGPWTFSVGMTEKYGGINNGPNPGVYGRAALGACLAMGYGMWAARLEVPVRALTVEIRASYDVRGELGLPLYDMQEADEPFIVTASGPVFIKGSLEVSKIGRAHV